MIHFFKLIRPINLLIIALTMVGVRVYLLEVTDSQASSHGAFALLVFSTVVIAAAGNVINDYFDIRADRINRPETVIIGKYIKRRWAIIIHWSFNTFAFCVGLYLGWLFQSFFFIIVHIASMTFLWWYSVSLKKKPLIGNVVVSLLSVFVIVLVVKFFQFETHPLTNDSIHYDRVFMIPCILIVYSFMCMAFLQNLAREIIKDAEDVQGDLAIGAKTIPMIKGPKFTIRFIGMLLMLFPVTYFTACFFIIEHVDFVKTLPISLAAIVNVVAFLYAFFATDLVAIKAMKNLLKVSMLLGVIYLFIPQ